ncbi:hypothetical protein DPMN_100303 [Dreissena polymorpha]|uniref:Uncharacterized protein n=1 Tax=Dreissena polymorpha TaxID=45954 RepID=A0A9D4LGT1_DREPO|nr:hypothetical protein DPMN_100303 [Dreissena polymorpha]
MIKFPDTEKHGDLPSWKSNRHTSIEVNSGSLTFSGSLCKNISSIMSTRNENAAHVEINVPVLAFTIHKSKNQGFERLDMTLVFQLFKGACTFTAVLLHYVYLVAFFLILAEGGDIALRVMRPLDKRNIIPYFLAVAYGIPAIIVGISLGATQFDGYGNERL